MKLNAGLDVIVVLDVALHPFKSVTSKLYKPGASPVNKLLACPAPPFILYDNGAAPPVANKVTVPSFCPAQLTFVCASTAKLKVYWFVNIALPVPVHPFTSITVMLYVPALKPLNTLLG